MLSLLSMEITHKTLQFTNQHALFVVCGKSTADFLYANNGKIKKVDGFKVELGDYDDNEGFSMRHTKTGKLYKAGRLRKDTRDIREEREFLNDLESKLQALLQKKTIDRIYLFAPGYLTKTIRESWPHDVQKMVQRSIRGNYTHHHPIDLIEKIEKKRAQGNDSASNKFIH